MASQQSDMHLVRQLLSSSIQLPYAWSHILCLTLRLHWGRSGLESNMAKTDHGIRKDTAREVVCLGELSSEPRLGMWQVAYAETDVREQSTVVFEKEEAAWRDGTSKWTGRRYRLRSIRRARPRQARSNISLMNGSKLSAWIAPSKKKLQSCANRI